MFLFGEFSERCFLYCLYPAWTECFGSWKEQIQQRQSHRQTGSCPWPCFWPPACLPQATAHWHFPYLPISGDLLWTKLSKIKTVPCCVSIQQPHCVIPPLGVSRQSCLYERFNSITATQYHDHSNAQQCHRYATRTSGTWEKSWSFLVKLLCFQCFDFFQHCEAFV